MKALALVFAFTLALQAKAQYDPFPDIPENHWVYQTLLKLQREGVVDIGQGLFFRGGRPSDRMELAQYTIFACNAMIYKLEWSEHDSTPTTARSTAVTLHLLAKETDDLAKMVALFAPEIKKRRVDADGLRREMLSFPKRIERVAGVALSDDPEGRVVEPTELANTPKNRWVYAALIQLQYSGLLVGYRFPFPGQLHDDRHTRANESREVIAGAVIQSYKKIVGIYLQAGESLRIDFTKLNAVDTNLGQIRVAINRLNKSLDALSGFDKNIVDVIHLTYEFAPEIKTLAEDPERMIGDLKRLLHGST